MRLPGLSLVPGLGGWSDDPLWATFYDWTVEHPVPGGVVWALGMHSDLRLLYDTAGEISMLPPGSRVLDVPCGGGVALRGLTPDQGLDYVAADIAQTMLDRTMASADRRGVAGQVTPRVADVADLPFADDSFDLVISLTGLHCFPDPARAVVEMVRVLRPGGVITGSALLNDSGVLYEPMRQVGRLAGLLGPGCTGAEVLHWLGAQGVLDAELRRSGALGYFRGTKS